MRKDSTHALVQKDALGHTQWPYTHTQIYIYILILSHTHININMHVNCSLLSLAQVGTLVLLTVATVALLLASGVSTSDDPRQLNSSQLERTMPKKQSGRNTKLPRSNRFYVDIIEFL